jgi:hypothetical protein
MKFAITLVFALTVFLADQGFAADVVLNEYNAVSEVLGFLQGGKSDSRLGRREGNGGDWFELVVITDHLDMRGWEIVISHRTGEPVFPGPGEQIFSLLLTADPIWADLRAGTIVTIAEDIPSNAGDYRPEIGEWWINVRASMSTDGRYISASNFAVSNDKTQLTILNALGAVVYGPSGEGISPLAGVGSSEVFKLEDTPFPGTTPNSIWYTDGGSSSFGLPNEWTDLQGPMAQNFSLLRAVVPYFPLESVVINEINSHSDAPEQDWIELFNTTGTAVDLSGWFLSDGSVNLMQHPIPAGTTIPGNGYLVFLEANLPFSLNGEMGEAVYLSQGNGAGGMTGGRTSVEFGPLENGVSFGRFPNGSGSFFRMVSRTRGSINSEPHVGPLVINEIMYHPAGPAQLPLVDADLEYVELHNDSSVDVPLVEDWGAAGMFPWWITGGVDFEFPVTAAVPASGFVLIVAFDPATEPLKLAKFKSVYGVPASTPIYGPFMGKLNDYSETVNLRRPDHAALGISPLVLRDTLTYLDWGDWPTTADGGGTSLERIDPSVPASDATRWAASLAVGGTPGAENSVLNKVPEPSATALLRVGTLGLLLLARRSNRRSEVRADRSEG